MSERKRFDKWSVLIPKVGQIIQVKFSEITFEAPVKARYTVDGKTFSIDVSNARGNILLYITPSASRVGMVDRANDCRPFWQVDKANSDIPDFFGEFIRIFFLN